MSQEILHRLMLSDKDSALSYNDKLRELPDHQVYIDRAAVKRFLLEFKIVGEDFYQGKNRRKRTGEIRKFYDNLSQNSVDKIIIIPDTQNNRLAICSYETALLFSVLLFLEDYKEDIEKMSEPTKDINKKVLRVITKEINSNNLKKILYLEDKNSSLYKNLTEDEIKNLQNEQKEFNKYFNYSDYYNNDGDFYNGKLKK